MGSLALSQFLQKKPQLPYFIKYSYFVDMIIFIFSFIAIWASGTYSFINHSDISVYKNGLYDHKSTCKHTKGETKAENSCNSPDIQLCMAIALRIHLYNWNSTPVIKTLTSCRIFAECKGDVYAYKSSLRWEWAITVTVNANICFQH